jgi:hypothetical protein
MENGPRTTFVGTAAEFNELKRLGTMVPEEAEPEPVDPKSLPGNMEVGGKQPLRSPYSAVKPTAPPWGLEKAIEETLARTAR